MLYIGILQSTLHNLDDFHSLFQVPEVQKLDFTCQTTDAYAKYRIAEENFRDL